MNNEVCNKINQILEYVRQKERQSGKTPEEINLKYTHGYCVSLATLIKSQLEDEEDVRLCEFGRTFRKFSDDGRYEWKGHIWHTCIAVGGLDEFDFLKPDANAYIFDINGGRRLLEMQEYLSALYPKPFDSNYVEDMTTIVRYCKSEIFIEEEGVIEDCYYELLDKRKYENEGSGEM